MDWPFDSQQFGYNCPIMLKRLAIAVVFIAYLCGRPCISEQQKDITSTSQDKTTPTHVAIDSPRPVSNCQPGTPQEKPLPRFERPEWVIVEITAVYALIAALTLGVIKRQADTMDRQTKEAKESAATATTIAKEAADAAKKSADALVSAERAWVLGSIRKTILPFPYTTRIHVPDSIKCELIFKNYGATPAIIESFSYRTGWNIPVFNFTLTPQYGERKVARIILAPQEEKVIGTAFPVDQFPDFSIEHAIIMGYVNYGGIFEGQRETKFCFGFDRDTQSFIPVGPAAYNDAT